MFKHFIPDKRTPPTKKKRGRPSKNTTTCLSDNAGSMILNNDINQAQSPMKKRQKDKPIEVYLLPSYYDDNCVRGKRMLHSKGCTRLSEDLCMNLTQPEEIIPDISVLESNEGITDLFAI